MTTHTDNIDLSLAKTATTQRRGIVFGAISGVMVLVALFALWPYQHGHVDYRTSVLRGLQVLVTNPTGREWIFCLFVPAITALLIYLRRDLLRGVPIAGSNWAIAPLVFSLLLYWVGYKADTRYLGYASAQLMVASLVIWFLGWHYMRLLIFPWIFLAFTWPFLPLEEMMAFPLRIFAAKSSTSMLNLLGVDCFREGTAVVSAATGGNQAGALFQLDVDDPCSGIRSLFSLLMISAFYGYIALGKPWQRAILFASAIPLAVAGNIVRMLLLAYGCVFFGSEFAVGHDYPSTYHELSGIVVFIVALFGMFSLARLLEFLGARGKRRKKKAPSAGASTDPGSIPAWRSVTALALGALVLTACFLTPAAQGLSEPGIRPALPTNVGSFWGYPIAPSPAEIKGLIEPSGVELSRVHYESTSGRSATATIIIGGPDGRTLHRPEVCLPGQGWKITASDSVTLPLDGGREIRATLLTVMRGEPGADGTVLRRKALNIYWYIGSGITAADYNGHIAKTLRDSIFRNINHRWSMVSLFTPLPPTLFDDPVAEQDAVNLMRELAREIVPHVANGPWASSLDN
ncbi:MAG: exosortase/archaeosortase family protein [Verrucomicrobiales bacterium]